MKLYPLLLFSILLKICNSDLICDIGSKDGKESILFKRINPNAIVIAFEANPNNYKKMKNNIRLNNIILENLAIYDNNGIISFYFNESINYYQGDSSTKLKIDRDKNKNEIKIKSMRLDYYINNLKDSYSRICLWIDVEGASYEVLSGIKKISNKVYVIHVELETKEIWENQKTMLDTIDLLKEHNFILLAEGYGKIQKDVVFINNLFFKKKKLLIYLSLFITKVISTVSKLIIHFLHLSEDA